MRVLPRIFLAILLLAGGWTVLHMTLLRPPPPPGVVVTHSPAWTGRYIGSPSFVIMPDGEYIASHDFFGPWSLEGEEAISRVYASKDKGATWECRSEIRGTFWSVIFLHRGALYILGVDHNGATMLPKSWTRWFRSVTDTKKPENHIVIRRSTDGGRTWTEPRDGKTGVLKTGNYGFAPTPVIEHAGRLWRAQGAVGMMSIPVDADLLDAESWRYADESAVVKARKKNWFNGEFEGWGEGGAVVDPHGQIVNIAKVRYLKPGDDHAALVHFDIEGRTGTFDDKKDFVKMPGARLKFSVRFDPVSKRYWAITNYLPERYLGSRSDLRRNVLALLSSPDLRDWHIERIVLEGADVLYNGFQYIEWDFEGDDIVGVCRTAWPDGMGGPVRQHDSNYLTFHRFKNFRTSDLKAAF